MKKFTFLVAALCATMMAFAAATAVKVTDASTLKAGDKIVIANLDGSQAMSTSQTTVEGKSYYRGVVDFDVKNVTTDVEQVELVASGSNFKLKVTGGYLYFDSSWEKNWLGTNATGTDFTFEASGDTLRLKEVASGRYIMYNTQSDPYRFSCYKASSGARKNGGTSIYTISGGSEGGEEGGGSEGGEEGGEVAIKDVDFMMAYYYTYDEQAYWDFDIYNYDNDYPELYIEGAVATSKSSISGTYDFEEVYGTYYTSANDSVFIASGSVTITYTGKTDEFEDPIYRVAGTLVGEDGVTYTIDVQIGTEAFDYDAYFAGTTQNECYLTLEDVVAIRTVEIDNTVYARDGRIYAEEGARIYSLTGLDVTRMNGNLEGIYIVKNGNKVAKVAVAK